MKITDMGRDELLLLVKSLQETVDAYKQVVDNYNTKFDERQQRSGDLEWWNCIAYSPQALREEAEVSLTNSRGDAEVMRWAMNVASNDDLAVATHFILNSDAVWADYNDNVVEGLTVAYEDRKKA